MLLLSDAIARTRLEAAQQARDSKPDAFLYGWFTVILSALTTLLVTVKVSLSAPTEKSQWPYRYSFIGVGVLAMIVSATVTALTGVKQFYDPQRSYKSEEAALLGCASFTARSAFLSCEHGTTPDARPTAPASRATLTHGPSGWQILRLSSSKRRRTFRTPT